MSSGKNLALADLRQHYLQGATVLDILVGPDPQDGKLLAVVAPDLDHFRESGETDIQGEVEWELEFYSHQLPPDQRLRAFVLTSQKLPPTEPRAVAALYQALAARRHPRDPAAPADESLSPIGREVVNLLRRKTGLSGIFLEDRLQLDLGFDSLALVEFLLALEDTFEVRLQEGEFGGLFTVAGLIRFIEDQQPPGVMNPSPRQPTWGQILHAPPPPANLKEIVLNPGVTGRLLNLGVALGFKFLLKLLFNLKVFGRKRLGPGSYILCPNHCSFLDGFLLFAAAPQTLRSRLYFFGYNNYFAGPVVKDIAKVMHVVPVNSARHLIPAMQTAAAILQQGGALGIFPEGARSLTGELRPFKQGVATLAREVGVPLVPVYIHGSYEAWGPNVPIPKAHPVQIVFGRQCAAHDLAAQAWRDEPGLPLNAAILAGLRREILKLREEIEGPANPT